MSPTCRELRESRRIQTEPISKNYGRDAVVSFSQSPKVEALCNFLFGHFLRVSRYRRLLVIK